MQLCAPRFCVSQCSHCQRNEHHGNRYETDIGALPVEEWNPIPMLLAGLKATKTTTEEFAVELSARRNQNKQNRVVVHPYSKTNTIGEWNCQKTAAPQHSANVTVSNKICKRQLGL